MATSADRYSPNAISGTIKKIGSYLSIFNGNKVAAIIVWLTSTYATSILIEELRGNANATGGVLDTVVLGLWGSSFLSALALQTVLTVAESPIWQGKKPGLVASAALVIDALVNAAAVWPFMQRFGSTSIYRFLSSSVGSNGEYDHMTAIILTVFVGIILAASPEKLWSGE
jgi:hypothetical protein